MHRLALIPFLLLVTFAASGQSFDCNQAQTPREKTICATPKLSALDSELAEAYVKALSALTPASAQLLRSDQREWLQWLDQICIPSNPRYDDPVICFYGKYTDRINLLAGASTSNGLHFFPRSRYFLKRAAKPPEQGVSAANPGYGYGKFSWPQIDNPTSAQQAWNKSVYNFVLKSVCCMEAGKPINNLDQAVDSEGSIETFYSLNAANPQFISVNLGTFIYSGGAHGLTNISTLSWWLDQGRALKTDDVFAAPGWHEQLAKLTLDKLMKNPGPAALWTSNSGTPSQELLDAIAKGVIDPETWTISSSGLTITFGQYAVGAYAIGMPTATFTWQELWPLLAPTLQPTTLPTAIPQQD